MVVYEIFCLRKTAVVILVKTTSRGIWFSAAHNCIFTHCQIALALHSPTGTVIGIVLLVLNRMVA